MLDLGLGKSEFRLCLASAQFLPELGYRLQVPTVLFSQICKLRLVLLHHLFQFIQCCLFVGFELFLENIGLFVLVHFIFNFFLFVEKALRTLLILVNS